MKPETETDPTEGVSVCGVVSEWEKNDWCITAVTHKRCQVHDLAEHAAGRWKVSCNAERRAKSTCICCSPSNYIMLTSLYGNDGYVPDERRI